MGKIIGIDIGGSTTKIIGFDNGSILSPLLVRATDPIASVYGAFGKFLNENRLCLSDISQIMVTGVGSSYINGKLFGIPTGKIDEFIAIGKGGLLLSQLTQAIIVSMGTGTAFVKADETGVKHIGGTGVGGGTLLGLSNRMLNVRDFNDLIETARNGNLFHTDLTVGDISHDILIGLPPDTTASNFGKLSDLATKADVALGIINLVFESVGTMSALASRIDGIRDVIITGSLTNVPQSRHMFERLGNLYNINYIIPQNAEYATAAGAAISFVENIPFTELQI